jgi:tRNA 2-selenouridine synthase
MKERSAPGAPHAERPATPPGASNSTTKDPAPSRAPRSTPGERAPLQCTVDELEQYDEIIDVRSESEFREDHIPGALNCPVLHDSERALVGTIYKQASAFEAKKIGAALVSANIARYLRERFAPRERTWRPLVYCWRGGGRSGALAHVLAQIGWRAGRLDGGYKAYRRRVLADLETLPERYSWRVVCGMTGTGKSRLLASLAAAGAQVLDLEALAAHRGSVLGDLPGAPQPTQKMFESLLWHALGRLDPERPVYVESESRKIGRLRVPQPLIDAMWQAACVSLEAPLALRVALLRAEYAHYLSDADALCAQLECLRPLHGGDTIARWQKMARERAWDALVGELLVKHYDPAYTRAITKHYPALSHAPRHRMEDITGDGFERLAREIMKSGSEPHESETTARAGGLAARAGLRQDKSGDARSTRS